ncbi:MAG: P-loop NTPase [Planctomycetota bacterium]
MSEVNQAFLRAYVKSRAAAASQPLSAPQGDVQRRVDPPISQAVAAKGVASAAPQTAVPPPSVPAQPVPVRTGVWSALGVERGIKGVALSQPSPAITRNGTNMPLVDAPHAVPNPPAGQSPAAQQKSPSLEALNQAWTKKRAPALPNLDLWPPQPQWTDEESSPISDAGNETQGAPPSIQTRTDPPMSRGMVGPHSPPTPERGIERESKQKRTTPTPFVPSWEVDALLWPEVVLRLEQASPGSFRQVGRHIANANQSGLRVMAVTSGERGVGRSTVAMHLARAAANAGLKVAIMDADAANPSLIDQLRLDVQHGWQDCLFAAVPLEEVAVHGLGDSITLFPLTDAIEPQQVHANLPRMSKLIRRISNAFDLVILDSGRLHLDQRELIGVSHEPVVDAAVVVVDTELSIKEKIDSAISILQARGLSSIGLVENFRA